MIQEKLQKLGLSDKEAKVYLAALELGGDSVQNIAKKSKVHRATTYLCLEKLQEMGLLITEQKGKKTIYAGEYPHKLLSNLLDKENELKKREVEILDLLPELKAVFNFSKDKPRVRFFEGFEGLQEMYQDTLYGNTGILSFLSVTSVHPELLEWIEKEYIKNRKNNNVSVRAIAPRDKEALNFQGRDKQELRETKLVDPQRYPFSIEINIYGENKIAFMSYSSKEMFGVIIDSKEVHKTLRSIFELCWDNLN